MKLAATLLLVFFSLISFSQVGLSNDGKYNYIRSFRALGHHIHWKGAVVNVSTNDTILTIHNYTHDHPAPIAHWSGSTLVFHEGDTIKVYDPASRKILYARAGMIWNQAENFFDAKNNILFFIRYGKSDDSQFELLMLNVSELTEKLLRAFVTSGSPITGIPTIVVADVKKRELLVEIETKDSGFQRIKIAY